jgi:hypothetical protein
MEESPGDESRINLAHSNVHYDNVGMVYYCYDLTKKCYDLLKKSDESSFHSNASAVYIGNGLCLTAAHAIQNNTELAVRFEINGEKTRLYHVSEFIIHPNYKENNMFDIAVLVLDKSVDRLKGLPPFYDFSEQNAYFKDHQHLLTYIGYGVKIFCNDWFYFSNQEKMFMQAYTYECYTNPSDLGIHSTPYGNTNTLEGMRDLIPNEAKPHYGMSGGAVIDSEYRLLSIIAGGKNLKKKKNVFRPALFYFLSCLNFISALIDCFFPALFFNHHFHSNTSVMWSVPLWPVKDWLENIRISHRVSSTYHEV